mmetsp:Transcript_8873/g.22869  ORF Transcript_8873/g.22869 Transcript_8873/m.22869 type:complete len:208 (-) Transcript_8873:575-1198(-)
MCGHARLVFCGHGVHLLLVPFASWELEAHRRVGHGPGDDPATDVLVRPDMLLMLGNRRVLLLWAVVWNKVETTRRVGHRAWHHLATTVRVGGTSCVALVGRGSHSSVLDACLVPPHRVRHRPWAVLLAGRASLGGRRANHAGDRCRLLMLRYWIAQDVSHERLDQEFEHEWLVNSDVAGDSGDHLDGVPPQQSRVKQSHKVGAHGAV